MPKPEDILIVGVGMVSAVGLSAAETASSIRSSVARIAASHVLDRNYAPFDVAAIPDEALPELDESLADEMGPTWREHRMLRLAAAALQEVSNALGAAARLPKLHIALPAMETLKPIDRAGFGRRIAIQCRDMFDSRPDATTHRGRSGGLAAIEDAMKRLEEDRSAVLIAGGVDSMCDQAVLVALDAEHRVASQRTMDGFHPGEAAAFVAITTRETAARRNLKPLARISASAKGHEPGFLGSSEPYTGAGLALTVQTLFEEPPSSPVAEVYSSMNGENYWAKEWSTAFIRNSAHIASNHRVHHPADCLGDTGAACGPLMIGLAALGIAQGYRQGPCLVYASADDGPRAAILMESP